MASSSLPRSACWRQRPRRIPRRHRTRPRKRQLTIEAFESRILLTGIPQIVDLNPNGASNPADFTQVGDVSFFVADDGTTGQELWKSDGTSAGTVLVRDINPGEGYQYPYGDGPLQSFPRELREVNGIVLFSAEDATNGAELWRTDGTTAGTTIVKDIAPGTFVDDYGTYPYSSNPGGLVELNGTLFFAADDNVSGRELWKSDGTAKGTVLVKDIYPGTYTDDFGTYPNSSEPGDLVELNGILFFSADDNVSGRELWKSDGTEAGTVLVKDIYPGTSTDSVNGETYPNASQPTRLTAVGDTLFFVAQDEEHGAELWKSDGTEAGTVLVADIAPGETDSLSENSALVDFNGTLLFVANDGFNGEELWRFDGTETGTTLVKDITPGSGGNFTDYGGPDFTVVDGTLFFSANDGTHGRELWKSDGTTAGTVMVKDISPGTDSFGTINSSYPFFMHDADGTLYFSAGSLDAIRELWLSDGTEAGTVPVGPGVVSDPYEIGSLNGTLIFSANDAGNSTTFNRELWLLEDAAADENVQLTIFADSQPIAIPVNVGVNADGTTANVFTGGLDGTLTVVAGSTMTVGDFFETWRTDAGLAGDNPEAVFSATEILGNTADTTNTIQMFVNGELSNEYDDHVMRDGDNIVLVYGSNPVVSLNTNFGPIVVELFEEQTPGTVDNFLNYVNDGDYLNSFFHRSDPGFVIQGGGFRTTSTTFTSTDDFTNVPTDPPIQNEPGMPNLRGTVAMAKTNDPDSATSQFFVNLSANTSLDNPLNSGGFTVFAQVLDMSAVNTIEASPIENHSPLGDSPFGELPVSNNGQLPVVQTISGNGKLTGVKFFDENVNGVRDETDTVLAGATVYVDANDNGQLDSGEAASTTDQEGRFLLQIEPGTHVVRATVTAGSVTTLPQSPDSYTVEVAIGREISGLDFGEAILSPPTGIDLLDVSDTGLANDDNRTNLNNSSLDNELHFRVDGVASGSEVRIFSDGVPIGTAQAFAETVTISTDGGTTLADGTHEITAALFFNAGQTDFSTALVVTVDTTPPAAIDNVAPDLAQAEQAYLFDANSLDEGRAGVAYSLAGEPAGMTIDSLTGEVTWTPTTSQIVPLSFEIVISDEFGNSNSQTVELTVLGVIPAFPDMYATDEDRALTVTDALGILANDGDANSGALTATLENEPSNGNVVLSPDGSFTYTPNNDFFGTDSFTYFATDGDVQSSPMTVTISVLSQPDPPTAVDDFVTAPNDGSSQSLDVLINDTSEPDTEQSLTVSSVTQGVAGGTVTFTDNTLSYAAPIGFVGTDRFTYAIQDSDGLTDTAIVEVDVFESASSTLSGFVYMDKNSDGARGADEAGVPGALITLTGTENSGKSVNRTVITTNTGFYSFDELASGTYQVTEKQPQALIDGTATTAMSNVIIEDNRLTNIVISGGQELIENNFGEASIHPAFVSITFFFASSASIEDEVFRDIVAAGEENAGNMDLAALIRNGSTDPPINVPPVATANIFDVADDIASGTLIGAVTAPAPLSDNVVFEITDSRAVDELKLRPDDHISGDPAAPLVLIEYLDLQCPSCQSFHPIVEELESEFDEELLVVRRHLPLTSVHQNAFAAARSAEAAARQGAFKEMADRMFENQRDWEFSADPQPFFDGYAADIGLDLVQFTADRQDPEVDARIQRDIDVANSVGAAATPTFYLNGLSLDLSDALDDFAELIDDELDDFDAPFVIDRLTGELYLAPGAILNANSNPTHLLTVNITDDNGVTSPVDVTVTVTDASASQAPISAAAAIDRAFVDWD